MKCDVRSEPWLTEGAIDFLSHFVRPGFRVLETGSGASTLWFAKRAKSVVSIEDDPDWYAAVTAALAADDYTFPLVHQEIEKLRAGGWDVTVMSGVKVHPIKRVPVNTSTAFCRRPA